MHGQTTTIERPDLRSAAGACEQGHVDDVVVEDAVGGDVDVLEPAMLTAGPVLTAGPSPAEELLAMDPRELIERDVVEMLFEAAESNEVLERKLEYLILCIKRQQKQINRLEQAMEVR